MFSRKLLESFESEIDLVPDGVPVGHPEGRIPVAFLEQSGQGIAKWTLFIEEADAADTERVVTLCCESGNDVV